MVFQNDHVEPCRTLILIIYLIIVIISAIEPKTIKEVLAPYSCPTWFRSNQVLFSNIASWIDVCLSPLVDWIALLSLWWEWYWIPRVRTPVITVITRFLFVTLKKTVNNNNTERSITP